MVIPSSASHSDIVGELSDVYKGRRCLITGHTGFKGSWLCLWLHRLGAELSGYALDPPTTPSLFEHAEIGDLVEDIRGDVCDYPFLAGTVRSRSPEIIFHLAAQPLVRASYDRPKETFDVNIGGVVNLLEAARACPSLKAIVVITSDKCYQNREWPHAYRETDKLGGHDPYSASKAAAEMVCRAYRRSFFEASGVGLATCRAGNVIGGGDWAADRIIPDAVRALQDGRAVPVRNPNSTRPWQHVLEPLYGYLLLGAKLLEDHGYSGEWNFGPPHESNRTVKDLVETFLSGYGKGSWEDQSSKQTEAPHEARFLALAWDKAFRLLGWGPIWDFEEAVYRTGSWYDKCSDGVPAARLCNQEIRDYFERLCRNRKKNSDKK